MGLSEDPAKNPLHFLSRYFAGDYFAVWRVDHPTDARGRIDAVNRASGNFRFHWNHSYRLPPVIRHAWDLMFFVGKGVLLTMLNGRYDVIVAYGPYRTGIAGWLLKVLTGARFILEVPGNPRRSLDFGGGLLGTLKRRISPAVVNFVVRRADHLYLRYPTQLPELTPDELRSKASVFPNFVPIRRIAGVEPADKYIFFMGYPWDLKGVDVLIRAFNRMSARHPDVRLKIMGHCPDRSRYIALKGDNDRIEFYPGTPQPLAMPVLEACTMFVLPSRTDAMARVLIEAMAAGKPIVASRVDGTPFYVKDGVRGLLFTSEDDADLAACMERLLDDPKLAHVLASNGLEYVRRELSEDCYVENFRRMVERTLGLAA